RLPAVLPVAVTNMVKGSVQLELKNIATTGPNGQHQVTEGLGSGLRLSNTEYLTAGHMIAQNNKIYPTVRHCGNLAVNSPTTLPVYNEATGVAKPGITLSVLRATGTV